MNYDQVTCSKCNIIKNRLSLGNNRYIDENNQHWRSRCCPDCSKEYLKKYHKINNIKKEYELICRVCNSMFIHNKPKSVYCNKKCAKVGFLNYIRDRNGSKPRNPRQVKELSCKLCSKTFKSKIDRIFCSKKCYVCHIKSNCKSKKQFPLELYCKNCQKVFIAKMGNNKYCSNKCINSASRKRNKKARKAYEKLREFKKNKRVPKWANIKEIENIYNNRPAGYDVDHIIPLNGKDVCGFHVEYNLQYLSKEDNNLKSNQFDGTYENNSWKVKT